MDLEIKTDPMDGVDQGMLYYTQQMNLAPTFDLNVARYPYQQTYPGKNYGFYWKSDNNNFRIAAVVELTHSNE